MARQNNHNMTEKGQSLMEFAFGAVILLILVAGIVDLGSAFFTYMALWDGAQEGAVYASLYPDKVNGIITRVRNITDSPIDFNDPNVIITPMFNGTGAVCAGKEIQVTVSYNYTLITPFIGTLIGTQEIPLSATVKDEIINPPCPPTE